MSAAEDELDVSDWAYREDVYTHNVYRLAPLIDALVERHQAVIAAVRDV